MSVNPQASLYFGPAVEWEDEFRSSMRALNDAYEAAGNLVVAGATGVDKGDLCKMFEPGSGRHMRFKSVFMIGKLGSLELRRRALAPLARFWNLAVADAEPLDDREARYRCEAALKSFGPLGEMKLLEIYGGRK